jgi:hypothetical protein
VRADLSQLTAIHDYPGARAAVAKSRQGVAVAAGGVRSALASEAAAVRAQGRAATGAKAADLRLRNMAIAAYMGLGYFTPASGPQGLGPSGTGTVSTMGGLTGTALADTEEMLRLVARRERKDVDVGRQRLDQARTASAHARHGVLLARASLGAAEARLAKSRQALAVLTRAATSGADAASLKLLGDPGYAGAAQSSGAARPAAIGGAPATGAGATPAASAASAASAADSPPAAGASAAASGATTTTAGRSSLIDAAATSPAPGTPGSPGSPTVLGPSVLSAGDLAGWFASTGHKANITVPIAELAADYLKAGRATGVRADIAFAQSVVETGFFSFPSFGQLTPKYNNFAGIGACDTCAHGWSFKNALTGVAAQMELLESYASVKPVPTPLVGPVGIGGCCPTWVDLAGKWASNLSYGISIMTVYHQMLAWLIPRRLVSAGLMAPAPAPAQRRAPTSPATTPVNNRARQAA